MTSAVDGWAVGDGGVILHWDGSAWRQADSPTTYPLYSVALSSASDGWAVGGVYSRGCAATSSAPPVGKAPTWSYATCSVILHWDGNAWRLVSTGLGGQDHAAPQLYSVASVSPSEAWAVGAAQQTCDGGACPWRSWAAILRWDGTDWREVYRLDNAALNAVAASASDAWAVGDAGLILHSDGHGWARSDSSTSVVLRAVVRTPRGEAWAVGDVGTILHWDGAWRPASSPTTASLSAIALTSTGDGWIAGRTWWNRGILLRYSLDNAP